jgi:hypothetical protein
MHLSEERESGFFSCTSQNDHGTPHMSEIDGPVHRLFNASAEKVMWRLRNSLFSHIILQEVGFFDRVRTGELMNRLSEVSRNPWVDLMFLRSQDGIAQLLASPS